RLHDLADAVVTLDGFNEQGGDGTTSRIEQPPRIWNDMHAVGGAGYGPLLWEHAAHGLFGYFGRNWLLRRSWAAYFVSRSLSLLAEAHAHRNRRAPEPVLPPVPDTEPLEVHKR